MWDESEALGGSSTGVGFNGVASLMSSGSGDGAGDSSNGFHGVAGRGNPVKGWIR